MPSDVIGVYVSKKAGEVLDFQIDYSARLAAGETLAASTSVWSVPAGITKDSDSQNGTTVTAWLSGGSAGTEYALINTVDTTGARTLVGVLRIKIEPVPPAAPAKFTQEQLAALRANYALGLNYVQYGDKREEFRSRKEMSELIAEMENELDPSGGDSSTVKRYSFGSHYRG